MALIKCAECGKDVSTEAKTCPSCGATVRLPKKPAKPSSAGALMYALVGVVGLTFVGAYMSNQDNRDWEKADQKRLAAMSPEQRDAVLAQRKALAASQAASAEAAKVAQEKAAAKARELDDDISKAERICTNLFEKDANDPSSVEWIRDERWFTFTSKDKKHATSTRGVRAKNAMGGLIKASIKCDLVKGAAGWTVVKMKQL